MSKPSTYAEILNQLDRATTVAEIERLQRQGDQRQQEIRERIQAITPVSDVVLRAEGSDTPAREAAARKGIAAVAEIDRELEMLHAELAAFDRLGLKFIPALAAARTEAARREVPKAQRALPGAMDRVRSALAALDESLAGMRRIVETLAEYPRLEPTEWNELAELPLSDDELAELLRLRDEVWEVRTLAVLSIPENEAARAKWPKAWPLFYEWKDRITFRRISAPTRDLRE